METMRLREKTNKDGTLYLRIPMGKSEAEYEVVVIIQPTEKSDACDERGWPPGYFEHTFGSITDATFERPPQGEMPPPVELD
jgi:hypothetical protein